MAAHQALVRCRAELATVHATLLAGHTDIHGLLLAYKDWSLEERLIMAEIESARMVREWGSKWPTAPPVAEEAPLKLEGGAQRSERKPAFYHLCRAVLELLCERMLHGETKHGRDNYKSGGPEFVQESYDHLVDHVLRLREEPGNMREHMGAILANGHILAWHWLYKPENFKLLWGTSAEETK